MPGGKLLSYYEKGQIIALSYSFLCVREISLTFNRSRDYITRFLESKTDSNWIKAIKMQRISLLRSTVHCFGNLIKAIWVPASSVNLSTSPLHIFVFGKYCPATLFKVKESMQMNRWWPKTTSQTGLCGLSISYLGVLIFGLVRFSALRKV